YLVNRPALLLLGILGLTTAQQPAPAQLSPTVHPPLPSNPSELWLVPSENDRAARSTATFAALSGGVALFQQGDYAAALAKFTHPSLANTALVDYAKYYAGLSQLRLGQVAEAR